MDAQIITETGGQVICKNELGKREITESTLFFMPHCGFSLYF